MRRPDSRAARDVSGPIETTGSPVESAARALADEAEVRMTRSAAGNSVG